MIRDIFLSLILVNTINPTVLSQQMDYKNLPEWSWQKEGISISRALFLI
jgi:hypothetical protein